MDPVRPLRILVVDDDIDTVESTVTMLLLHGFSATGVVGGDGVSLATAGAAPDVVLIDLAMPGIDGLEVARRLRDGAAGTAPVLIAITGCGSEADRRDAAGAGFDLHLLKPVPPAALCELLARIAGDREWEVRRTLGRLRRLGRALARRTKESQSIIARSGIVVAGSRRLLDLAATWSGSCSPRNRVPVA